MKKLLLSLCALCFTSCGAQQFEEWEAIEPIELVLPLVVGEIQNDTAWLYTENFQVKYEVDLGKFEIGKKYVFKLFRYPDGERGGKAKIIWFRIHPDQAAKDIREKMKS